MSNILKFQDFGDHTHFLGWTVKNPVLSRIHFTNKWMLGCIFNIVPGIKTII